MKYFAFTVDVEGWQGAWRTCHVMGKKIFFDLSWINNFLKKERIKATFFVTGEIVKEYRGEITDISEMGHEIACHSFYHELFNEYNFVQIKKILQKCLDLFNSVGFGSVGFRAPSFLMTTEIFNLLGKLGFLYDSSVISTRNILKPKYGHGFFSRNQPYFPSVENLLSDVGGREIIELPLTVHPIFRIPLNASTLRVLGTRLIKSGIEICSFLKKPIIFLTHDKDVVNNLPRINGVPETFYKNVGLETKKRLKEIIDFVKRKNYKFVTCKKLAEKYYL